MTALSSNTKYYKEAYSLFQQCTKNEDRQDLANKVLDEASSSGSDTSKITRACSREFEQLMPHVTTPSILASFFDRLTQDELDEFIRDRAASFVLEKLLTYLPNVLSTESERVHSSYERLFECVRENFNDYMQESGTGHIIASTIAFLHPLIISPNTNEYESLIDGGQTAKKFAELSSDWNVLDKLRQMKKLIKKCSVHNEFVYATLLRTCGYISEKLYTKLVTHLCEKYYSNINVQHLLDKCSSFLFEVLVEFPSNQRETILYPLVFDQIDEIYLHPIGNFFIQRLLLTLNDKKVLEKIYQLLIHEERFGKLVHEGQIRLLITFIRVCERFSCHYEELVNRLKTTIHCTKNNTNEFIPCVLKLRADNADTQLITKEGSLVVQALLRADKVDSLTRQSFLSLTGEQIASIACHPSGSHLLCQLILKSNLWPILRQKNFYEKLNQMYTKMACDKAACWFVTQLWKSAITIDQKLEMAKSLAKDLQILRSHTYARFITYEMNLTAFCSRPDQWKRSFETVLKKHSLLDELDDDNDKRKKKKKKKT
ncbi:unnamed protein product [Adineta ricciae]|nr:unnamed protein product [Adineta ricciae]